jgi:DNA-binding IclR family transcriptional regulator
MTDVFIPQAHSLPHRVLVWFLSNPDEELNCGDIAEKFDGQRLTVHTLLKKVTDAGYLKRIKNSDLDLVYIRGPQLGAIAPAWPPATTWRRKARCFITRLAGGADISPRLY